MRLSHPFARLTRHGKLEEKVFQSNFRLMAWTNMGKLGITKERVILLFAILTNKSIDVGRVLYYQITQSMHHPKLGLYFSSLINELCKQAEVTWEGHEIWEGPRHPINDGVIASYKEGDDNNEDELPQPYRPVSTMFVVQRWEYMNDQLNHIEENRCNLVDILRQMVAHWNNNIDNFRPVTSLHINEENDKEEED
ncbi:hypothetical protein TIFTF001_040163 [Ficus carica]|uniref:Uncharacterized protein n=1 Tax=Ficus carica TaxID=3494 RepID=A0AA87YU04_FICCA|nr:hypothetical protein TIFTF001_040163 [Ficus carica]